MNMLPTTRHSLLLRIADAENNAAWEEFMSVYETAINRYARSRGLQAADADDVTQLVLAAVVKKAGEWDADEAHGSFRAWLFRVTRNLAAKAWKDRARAAGAGVGTGIGLADAALADIPEPADDEKTVFHLEYRRALFHWAAGRVKGRVAEVTWRAFWMTAIDRVEPATAARTLGMSMASVYTAKCRVMAHIRDEIERFEASGAAQGGEDQG